MNQRVLILGGRGRIGNSVAEYLAQHTAAEITITGRKLTTGSKVLVCLTIPQYPIIV